MPRGIRILGAWVATAGVCCIPALANAGLTLDKGVLGMETFYYPSAGMQDQEHGNFSAVTQLEWRAQLADSTQLRLTPFVRLDAVDSNRNSFDLREAEIDFNKQAWRLALGMRRVSWSVTETTNTLPHQVVDIVNQRDLAGDPMGQEKLGAAMAMVSRQGESAIAELYLLPWFRERRFPDTDAREHPLRGMIDLNGETQFVSAAGDTRLGAAIRLERSFSAGNLAFIQYRGYAPQPVITPDFTTGASTELYYLTDMSALTVQATVGAWLLKTETAYFNTALNPDHYTIVPNDYWSTVSGIEYTFVRALGQSDLGIIAEWLHDSRGDDPNGTAFYDDLFAGARWVPNDQSDSQLLLGVVRSLDQRAVAVHVQFERRIGTQWQLKIAARGYSAQEGSALHALSDDQVAYLRLQYFF